MSEYDVTVSYYEDALEEIENYISAITPEGYIIMEGAYQDLIEDLDNYLLLKMKHVLNQNEINIAVIEKEYWVEPDD